MPSPSTVVPMDDPPRTLAALRKYLAGLAHSGRMRAMVGYGRVARQTGREREAARQVLAELAAALIRIEAGAGGETAHGLEAFESDLAPEGDPRLRRLALGALIGLARGHGWSDERRERLAAWRADPAGLVAQAAQFTFVPD